MYKRILVGYNGSDGAKQALIAALQLARSLGACVCALSVEGRLPRYAATLGEVEEVEEERHAYFDKVQHGALRIAEEQNMHLDTMVLPGPPAETIVEYAREGNFDLIVMGHKGHSRIHEYLVGAATDRVAHLAPCSVLIVR